MTFCTSIYVPQRVNPTESGDTLTFPVVPPLGYIFIEISQQLLNGWL